MAKLTSDDGSSSSCLVGGSVGGAGDAGGGRGGGAGGSGSGGAGGGGRGSEALVVFAGERIHG